MTKIVLIVLARSKKPHFVVLSRVMFYFEHLFNHALSNNLYDMSNYQLQFCGLILKKK
jgi:hypothetical protein